MSLSLKCMAVALSAFVAATPVIPAQAFIPAATIAQPATPAGEGVVQQVQQRKWIPRGGRHGANRHYRGNRNYGANRYYHGNRRYSGNRNWNRYNGRHYGNRYYGRNRHYRGYYNGYRGGYGGYYGGYRHGYYNGYRGYRYRYPGYRYYDGYWFPLAAFGAGALIGGAIANDYGWSNNYGTRVYSGDAHTNWCYNRYRSYREYDNTFQPYYGPRRQCISPYS